MRPTIYHQSSIINDRQQSTIINNLHQHQHLHQQFIISILVPTATTTMVTMATMGTMATTRVTMATTMVNL